MPEDDVTIPPLPVDIPWKRLCVSHGVTDKEACDKKFPLRWKPSIAIFTYEPAPDAQPYDDLTLSYVKITCTITGLGPIQPNANVGILDYWYDSNADEFMADFLLRYYGCYGAVLEVSVVPEDTDDLKQFPYIIDFQPKKRELYELVSQTGSTLSRSLNAVKVSKQGASTSNNEVMDSDTGVDWSELGTVAGGVAGGAVTGGNPLGVVGGAALGGALGGMFGGGGGGGGKSITQAQQTNIHSTDNSLEKREEFSHSTQITQMYHQLTSYHQGTNRAVFFVQPRPHIVQNEKTFVNGPRVLEGIQEFMLIVAKPKNAPNFCIDATLETAHIDYGKGYRTAPRKVTFERSKSVPEYHETAVIVLEEIFKPEQGYRIDTSWNGDGYDLISRYPSQANLSININADGTEAKVRLEYPADDSEQWGLGGYLTVYKYFQRLMGFNIEFHTRSDSEVKEKVPQKLFLAGLNACCCVPEPAEIIKTIFINYESKLNTHISAVPNLDTMNIYEANQLGSDIAHQMLTSFNSPNRYPRGLVPLSQAQFVADTIADFIDNPSHPDNEFVRDMAGVDPETLEHIRERMPDLRRARLLRMRIEETRDRLGISAEQAVQLRQAALRYEDPIPPEEDRWDSARTRQRRAVPDLRGMTLEEAHSALAEAGLQVGGISVQDNDQPTNTVLEQRPTAGSEVKGGTEVTLVVSSGMSVRIPDIVGRPLSEAMCMLRDAGLTAEPDLQIQEDRQNPPSTVLESDPPPRYHVTPNTVITLVVSRRSGNNPPRGDTPRGDNPRREPPGRGGQ